jgi:hypothetical protein
MKLTISNITAERDVSINENNSSGHDAEGAKLYNGNFQDLFQTLSAKIRKFKIPDILYQ